MRTITKERLLSGSILDAQIAMETDAVRQGVVRYRRLAARSVDKKRGASLKPAERMLVHWFQPLVKAIRAQQRAEDSGEEVPGSPVWRPVFRSLRAERLAVATIHEALSLCMRHPSGVPFVSITRSIGRAVFAELHMDLLRDQHDKQREGFWESNPDASGKERPRTPLEEMQHRFARLSTGRVNWWAKKSFEQPIFHVRASAHVGARLLWELVGVASARSDKFELAFHHERRRERNRRRAFIRINRRILDIIEEGHQVRELLRPRHLPMLVPPYSWKADAAGGYVRNRTALVSKATPAHKRSLANADLSRVHDGISAIDRTAWRINKPLLELVQRVWTEGGGEVSIPRQDDLPLPPMIPAQDEDERRRMKRERRKIHQANERLGAEREEFHLKMQVAGQMAKHGRFYMPHQLDFRSRGYPVPKHLNHQGDDLCRGVLEFAEARPMSARGLWWLKVHAANCYGIDKVPFGQRVDWVNANVAAMTEAVEYPDKRDWWKQADKPWQFLAACHAIVSPEAADHLPVQLDGTCNGLQHYSALGRDRVGAESVNMMPANAPRDPYAAVAAGVARLNEEQTHELAGRLASLISRPIVKQTTLSSYYGVTESGARTQVLARLKEAGFDEESRFEAADYLSKLTLQAIGEMCVSARNIMDWLRIVAGLIARKGRSVCWTTPIGFPVVQPYRRFGRTRIKTVAQTVTLAYDHDSLPVRIKKQIAGFAPNYVHGLDAAHMFETARGCREAGIEAAFVHDCYWSHAETTDTMNHVLREKFVALHERPLLEELRTELQKQHPDLAIPPPPERGDFDIREVLRAPYFFS